MKFGKVLKSLSKIKFPIDANSETTYDTEYIFFLQVFNPIKSFN